MNIRPSAAIRQNYKEIADLCRKTAYPLCGTGQQRSGNGKKEIMTAMRFLCQMPQCFLFFEELYITSYLLKSGILSLIKFKTIPYM